MKKRILSLCLVLVLLATAVIGGTLAYFTDTDEAQNVFTVGDVNIELHESNGGNENDEDEDYIAWLATQEVMPGVEVAKIVTVENTGSQPAYIRVVITIPKNVAPVWRNGWENDWNWSDKVNADGSKTYTFQLKNLLGAGTETQALMEKFTLDAKVDNLSVASSYSIPVNVYAIQSAGLSYDQAFAELDTAANIAKTEVANTPNDLNAALQKNDVVVQLGDDVTGVGLVMGTNTVVDGNGNTLKVANASDVANNAGIATYGGTIKNITVSGENIGSKGFRAVYVTGKLTDDLVVDGATLNGVYALNVQSASTDCDLLVKNSTMNGAVSFAPVKSATFVNTTFADKTADNRATYFKPYSDMTLDGCTFASKDCKIANGDGIAYVTVTMNNCNTNGTKIEAANIATMINVTDFTGTFIVDGVSVSFNNAH